MMPSENGFTLFGIMLQPVRYALSRNCSGRYFMILTASAILFLPFMSQDTRTFSPA